MFMQMTQNVYQLKELFSTRMFRGLLAITSREWPVCNIYIMMFRGLLAISREWPVCNIKQPQPPLDCVDPIQW
jgi:hypothetical protein